MRWRVETSTTRIGLSVLVFIAHFDQPTQTADASNFAYDDLRHCSDEFRTHLPADRSSPHSDGAHAAHRQ